MGSVSYSNLRHMVLDTFYSYLISKPELNLTYEQVLGHVTYEFECGFSKIEVFIVEFIVYILCSDFKVSKELSNTLKKKLSHTIESSEFDGLIYQVDAGDDDRTELLSDMFIVGLITQEKMLSLI